MKISKKLFLGFSLVIFLAIVVGVIGIIGMNRLRVANRLMYEKRVVSLEYIGKATAAFKQTRIDCRQVVISSFNDDLKGALDAKIMFENSAAQFKYWLNECENVITIDELSKFYKRILELFDEGYLAKAELIITQSIEDIPNHADKLYINVLLASIIDVSDRIESLLIGSMDLNSALAEQTNYDNESLVYKFMQVLTLLLMSAVFVAVAIAFYITRSISIPINEAADVLRKIAKGDFNAQVNGNYKGELAVIKNSVNETAVQLSVYLAERLQEEKIRELAAIVEIADAGIIMKDKNGFVRKWNIGAENILGYKPEEMVGKTTHYYAPVESHSSIDEIDARLAKGEHIAHVEVIRKHKNGQLIDCSASYTPIINDEGKFTGAVAIFHDITDVKKAEQKARNLAAIISMADAGVIVKDTKGVVTEWNIGAENILGYKPDEMIGKTTHYYAPAESHKGIDEVEERLEKGEHIAHVEVVRKHKDGHLVDCSASYTPIFDDDGKFLGSVAIFHDITDVKQAVQKARNLAAIVSMADAGIIVKDTKGVVTEWNVGAENIFGYKPDEIIGKTTHYYAPEESHKGIDEVEERLENGEHIAHVEVVRKHKDGRLVDCSASYTPIFDDDRKFLGSVAIFHDITDKTQMELALKKANMEAEVKHQIILSSLEYSSKLQKNLLPRSAVFEEVFSDYSIIWKPRDIVGGDMYWLKSFAEGALLCVCDCTGHGTPGALLTMLVASTFDTMVDEKNYKDTSEIIWLLDRQISTVLNAKTLEEKYNDGIKDGCDLAVLYVAKDGSVTISSGNTRVFICDGKEVTQIKGQKLFIGEGNVKSKDDVKVITIPANCDNKFYVASDGLYDQLGGENRLPFGYKTIKNIILENHNEKQSVISDKIWEAFKNHQGNEARRDDMQLISFKP